MHAVIATLVIFASLLWGGNPPGHGTGVSTNGTATVVKAFDTCADCSASQDPSQATLTKIHKDGYQLFMFDASTWGSGSTGVGSCQAFADDQGLIQRSLAAGLKVGLYTRNPICYQVALNAVQPYWSQLQFFALDVEVADPGNNLPGSVVTTDEVAGVQADGVRPIVYSGSGMWPTQMGNSTQFSNLPLWDTVNDGTVQPSNFTPSLTKPAFQPYGGWTAATLRQDANSQTFSVTLENTPVDLDSVSSSFLK